MHTSILVVVFFLCSSGFAYDTEWWKHTIIYELIPYVFKDSDGDGIGDLRGITSKLDHFVDLGIETIHLTPTFETTSRDMGYDVIDYYKVDPRLGTMDDFDELVREMKKRNMKLVLDLVINHCSHKNDWFNKSIHRIEPYTDFYIWKDSKGIDTETNQQIPPNKWKILKFWLNKDVAGFRLDAVAYYFEDEQLRDDDIYGRMHNQPETIPFIHEYRLLLDEHSKSQGDFERIFAAEVHNGFDNTKYYDQKDYPLVHFTYNIFLSYLYFEWPASYTAKYYKYYINTWMALLSEGRTPLWMTDEHDYSRGGSAISPEYADVLTILSMMVPGSVIVYYGQEIGMKDGFIMENQMRDYSGRGSRDPNRLIMQWDDSTNAGFSTNLTTYSPSNSDYFYKNVQNEKTEKLSNYHMFKDLSALRKTDLCKYGKLNDEVITDGVYTMTRLYQNEMLTVFINYNDVFSHINARKVLANSSSRISVVVASVNAGYSKGFIVEPETLETFFMRPASSVVLHSTLQPNV